MKFTEMPYDRPDIEQVKAKLENLTKELKNSQTYREAREVFIRKDDLEKHILTLEGLASVRHSIDTRIEYYKNEYRFWNEAMPQLQEYLQNWTLVLMESPFKEEFEKEFGKIIFTNAELELKAFSPEIIPEMQEENNLVQEYDNLIASAQIPFEGGTYTISQMQPFKNDADKFRYSHLAAALKFIPYGTMVDHFQHIVYEQPELTAEGRHAVWKKLLGIYMPWMKLDGDIPFYSEGEGWQRQSHIYGSPFYYIDYCLAQTVSLEFWAMIQEDVKNAWEHYMAYTKQGGTATFTELLANAGLKSPFDEETLKTVCDAAAKWLNAFDKEKLV